METDTTPIPATVVPKRPAIKKRRFTPQFKARIVKLCKQPGHVMPQIARNHDLGLNLVKRWVREHQMCSQLKGFAPIAPIGGIRIKSTRGHQRIVVAWQSAKATWVYLSTKHMATTQSTSSSSATWCQRLHTTHKLTLNTYKYFLRSRGLNGYDGRCS